MCSNSSPIYWFSKKKNSVESSSFGSEFTAMNQTCECLRGFKCKLQTMGISCEGPSFMCVDNQSVSRDIEALEHVPKKKCQSIACHLVIEGVARDEWRTAYVNTDENELDLLTKTLPNGEKRKSFVRRLLHHVFRSDERRNMEEQKFLDNTKLQIFF